MGIGGDQRSQFPTINEGNPEGSVRFPFHPQLPSTHRAVSKVVVDQGLVRDAGLFSHLFEVIYDIAVQTHGYSLLEVFGVGVFLPPHI